MRLSNKQAIITLTVSIFIAGFSTFLFTHNTLKTKSAAFAEDFQSIIHYAQFRKKELITRFETDSCNDYTISLKDNLVTSVYLIDEDDKIICYSGDAVPLFGSSSEYYQNVTILPQGLLLKSALNDISAFIFIHQDFIEKRTKSIFGDAFEYIEFFSNHDINHDVLTFGYYDFGPVVARIDIKRSHYISLFARILLFTSGILFFLSHWFLNNSNIETKTLKYLKEAIKSQTFTMNYQPLVDKNENIRGFEALIRWNHPEIGFVSPDDFIPLAEQHGLIHGLTDCVFEMVINEVTQSDWRFEGERIGINVPPNYIEATSNLEKLRHYYEQISCIGYEPVIELTERELITNDSLTQLQKVKELGYLIAIDDFGTGYTGLSMLSQLPIDYIKVDRFFVNSIENESVNVQLLETILHLGKKLNLPIVAEGVETRAQADYLKAHDCDRLQGYLFAKPMPWSETKQYL